ncbi:MAG: ABC transporter substrate-binding protein [Maricaulaceae bacterium]
MIKNRFRALCAVLALSACGEPETAPETTLSPDVPWSAVTEAARGQTVYWNAWAGDERINAYLAWAAETVAARYDVRLVHVKLADTAEAVSRILAEREAGRRTGGSVDLLWINGENFAALKQADMLHGPFVDRLPNAQKIDFAAEPVFETDFTVPVEGFEAPWGLSKFVFITDAARTPQPPRDFPQLLEWAQANPGRFTYPAPPNFIGVSFLKQALLSVSAEPGQFAQPAGAPPDIEAALAPLWAYLDALHPYMWREGRGFPASGPAQRQLFADSEVAIAMTFNPQEAASAVAAGQLPVSTMTYGFTTGGLANAHFLAIPANARAKAGALVVVNFLLSPEAQARKADPRIWGDAPSIAFDRLSAEDQDRLASLEGPDWESLGPSLDEPHPSWVDAIEAGWLARYGGA